MVELNRDSQNRIYADMAYRIGRVIKTYTPPDSEPNFEVTLQLFSLQGLLTNCQELIRSFSAMKQPIQEFEKTVVDIPQFLGIRRDFVKKYNFPEKLTYEKFINALRNSFSHPIGSDKALEAEYPSTGYTTVIGTSGTIERIVFWDAPDFIKYRPKKHSSAEKAEKYIKDKLSGIKGIATIEVDGNYQILKDGKPFGRVCRIELTPKDLKTFVIELSNYLAQPIQENWDGNTINRLVG